RIQGNQREGEAQCASYKTFHNPLQQDQAGVTGQYAAADFTAGLAGLPSGRHLLADSRTRLETNGPVARWIAAPDRGKRRQSARRLPAKTKGRGFSKGHGPYIQTGARKPNRCRGPQPLQMSCSSRYHSTVTDLARLR